MRLTLFSHKPCWRDSASPTGVTTNGGFPLQVKVLSTLFEETRLVVPLNEAARNCGGMPITGRNLTVVGLSPRLGKGFLSKLSFGPWLVSNIRTIAQELRLAGCVHAPIPGDVGTVGMLGAWLMGKPLFVRHCGNWLLPKTIPENFWKGFMEFTAGGRNVMMATGGSDAPPSNKNPNVQWIFSTSLYLSELEKYAVPRRLPQDNAVRLIIAARQEKAKGSGRVIQALPLLIEEFPKISFEVLGQGSAIPEFRRLAAELNVEDRVTFAGQLNHNQVMERLSHATLFVFPTAASDGFPKAVLEGLAMGLPVIATPVSVLPKLLGCGGGIIIENGSPESIASGVRNLVRSASRYESMSIQAIRIASQYSLEAWSETIGRRLSSAWGQSLAYTEGEGRHE